MRFFTHSEPGGHPTNEDAIGIIRIADDPVALICALSDGQGGQAGGAVAAQTAVDSFLEKAQSCALKELVSPHSWEAIGETVDRSVSLKPDAGYATCIGLVLIPSFVIGISNGDSADVAAKNTGGTLFDDFSLILIES